MRYESVAALFFLVLTALLWTDVLCAEVTPQPDDPKGQDLSLNTETVPSLEMSSSSSDLNVELLLFSICQFYGPVCFNTVDRKKAIKILIVMSTLSSLFENLKYVGKIEVDEVLAYYLLLSELSFIKKRSSNELKWRLMTWPLPKGNLTLSLYISTGSIDQYTLLKLASYLPYISDKPARLAAVNYCLDRVASGSMCLDDVRGRILLSAFEPWVVHKLKQISHQSTSLSAFIAGSLLHFAPAELEMALVDDLNEALAKITATTNNPGLWLAIFWREFAKYSVTHRSQDFMKAILERNALTFKTERFFNDRLSDLSALNKIKFGAPEDISEAEPNGLLASFTTGLVFNMWDRVDVPADDWIKFANDPSNICTLSRLAVDPERFFQNHFSVDLFNNSDFRIFLKEFKYYPSSSKKKLFHELLRGKVEEHHETVLALLRESSNLECLVQFFIDQEDKVGLTALNRLVSAEILGKQSAKLSMFLSYSDSSIVRICQLLYGRVDDGCIDSLSLLAERIGAAEVLRSLDYSIIRANNMGEILRTLGISRERMDAALSSLSRNDKPEDELAVVLRRFHEYSLFCYPGTLPACHSLWFYMLKKHQEAFIKYVHPNIQQNYLPKEPSLLERFRQLVRTLWP